MSKTKIFYVLVSIILVFLFLLIFFPTNNPIAIAFAATIIVLIFKRIQESMGGRFKPITKDWEKRYKTEKIILIVVDTILYVFATLGIMSGLIGFFTEKNKDVYSFCAMGIIAILGLVCLFFSVLINKFILRNYRNFQVYKEFIVAENYGQTSHN